MTLRNKVVDLGPDKLEPRFSVSLPIRVLNPPLEFSDANEIRCSSHHELPELVRLPQGVLLLEPVGDIPEAAHDGPDARLGSEVVKHALEPAPCSVLVSGSEAYPCAAARRRSFPKYRVQAFHCAEFRNTLHPWKGSLRDAWILVCRRLSCGRWTTDCGRQISTTICVHRWSSVVAFYDLIRIG